MSTLGYIHTEETKEKISRAMMGNRNGIGRQTVPGQRHLHTVETRRLLSENMKCLWSQPSYRQMYVEVITRSHSIRPTLPEIKLEELIKDYNLPYEYNGQQNGIVIQGVVPDFIGRGNLKAVVEVFGDYWHGGNFSGRLGEQELIDHYKLNGYKCLILWEHEIWEFPEEYLVAMIILLTKGGLDY